MVDLCTGNFQSFSGSSLIVIFHKLIDGRISQKKPQCSEKNPCVPPVSAGSFLTFWVGGKVQRREESDLNFQTRPEWNAGGRLHQTCTDFQR